MSSHSVSTKEGFNVQLFCKLYRDVMQKGFTFLLIIWDFSFLSGYTATNALQYQPESRAVIPCQHFRRDANTFGWFYKKQERSDKVQTLLSEESGIRRYDPVFQSRMELLKNGSLVIGCLTEEDQGLYWCKVCFQNDCLVEQPTVISIKKEIHKETQKMLFIPAGESLTHACPGELPHLKWTFKASDTNADRHPVQEGPSYSITSSKSLEILNVTTQNAGQYTCSIRGCNGRWKQLLTINLCVITVHHNEDSSDSCAVVCDVESSNIEPNSTSNVHTGTRILSVSRAPNGSLNCRTTPIFVGDSGVNGTNRSTKDVDNTTGTESELIPVVYAASALLACLILMALLIWYLTPRLQGVYPIEPYCCGLHRRMEEENPVVYSSIIIRRYADTGITMAQDNSVYSEIRK